MGRVSIRGVAKQFGPRAALGPVDLDIEPGSVVTVLGPSGCGKTTLLRLIAGLERPSAGLVRLGDEPPLAARHGKRIGFVPQSPALLPWRTVEANARLLQDVNRGANPAYLPDAVELLERVGLGEFRDALPHELSGGMQQRVGLVRAFALGAPYLLMDEPFAALDEITRAEMRHLLDELRGGTGATVVFVTHSLAEAVFLSDRVVVMSARPGRIVGDVAIDLPRPRTPDVEDDPAFFAYETELRRILREGLQRSVAAG
ncbi:MAG TPA: ABC transporter ATP-binding protein [Ilumatobacter sp.]|nr:ABC transporter ATP-binding protein [Ilumatobacter sp.]